MFIFFSILKSFMSFVVEKRLFNFSNLKLKNKITAECCDFIFWWRWRELNPRPITFPHRLLRVYFVIILFPQFFANKHAWNFSSLYLPIIPKARITLFPTLVGALSITVGFMVRRHCNLGSVC